MRAFVCVCLCVRVCVRLCAAWHGRSHCVHREAYSPFAESTRTERLQKKRKKKREDECDALMRNKGTQTHPWTTRLLFFSTFSSDLHFANIPSSSLLLLLLLLFSSFPLFFFVFFPPVILPSLHTLLVSHPVHHHHSSPIATRNRHIRSFAHTTSFSKR